jgi:hypothetical protein
MAGEIRRSVMQIGAVDKKKWQKTTTKWKKVAHFYSEF